MPLVEFMTLKKGDCVIWNGESREVHHLELNEDLKVFRVVFSDTRRTPVITATAWRDDFEALIMRVE